MTEITGKFISEKSNHIYGGEIYVEDFNTYFPNKRRISSQKDIDSFQKSLENKHQLRDERKKYKNMTLEDLKAMKIISNTTGRPDTALTNEKWQKEINVRKCFIEPYDKDIKKLSGKFARESGSWNEETQGEYYGQTNWQEYCNYINDVLRSIRSGERDYCYFLYQILDILKFHYNDLKTKYCDGYWEVWLER